MNSLIQSNGRENWLHGCLGTTGLCLFWKKPKVEMQVTSPVGNCCTLASQERQVSFGIAGVFNDEQNAVFHWLKGDFRCSTGMPGMGPYLLWGPAPSAASSLLCDALCSTAVGKVGHQNTLNELVQRYLASLDLFQAEGWTCWPPQVPCKQHSSATLRCNEGAERVAGGACSPPALGCSAAPSGQLITAATAESWQLSRMWLFLRCGEIHLLSPEKSLWYSKQSQAPAPREAGVPPVLTLYTAQSRPCLLPLWPSQAANAECCWSLMNETLPSAA